jgi:hypothetical protein
MKHLIPHGRDAEFRIFLQEKYGILLDEVGDDVDITDKISDFIYGNNTEVAKEEILPVEDTSDKLETIYRSKVPVEADQHIVEAVWFEAVRKNVGDTIFVVDVFFPKDSIRFVMKDKDESMEILKKANRSICGSN